ncbi:MAG: cytochrome c oxidase subunit I [Gemmatimonadales bacterium]|nr:cytochrome c oxidase subunit I [Gemmatimonadales bacterium]
MATTALEHAPAYQRSTIVEWLTTVDHKKIGIMYGASAFIFFLIGGIEALIIRAQLATPNGTLVSAEMYNQLFTMHGTTMIFLAVMPLSAMFFNFFVPLLIGARDVAFPRLNAMSLWVFILGGIFLNASFLFAAAPNGGWFGYAPLSSRQYSPGMNMDFWAIGLQILGIASIAAGVNFFTTIINMRARGMTLMRMPIFVWMTLITQVLVLLSFPVITIALVMLTADRTFGSGFFVTAAGGDPMLWQHLFWVFGHPEVYILILPAFGIVSEVLPVFSRKPLFGYSAMVFSGAFIAFLGFGVWSHHMFATGMGPLADSFFSLATMLIAVPTGVKIFNWIGTVWGGSISLKTPMLFALGFIAMFIIGGLSGVMHSVAPADLQQTDTYFVVAHFHYVLFGGSIFALTAGAYYWWPKMFGRMLDEGLGKWHFWLSMIGFNVTFMPMHWVGLLGMPRRVYTYPEGLGFDLFNMVQTVGAFILALSILVFMWNVIRSWRGPADAPADPWGGATLEWSIPSPPQEFNFAEEPVVAEKDAFWAMKDAAGVDRFPEPGHVSGRGIHMPGPSWWPVVVAVGLLMFFVGLMVHRSWAFPFTPVSIAGFALMVFGVFKWAYEPVDAHAPQH